MGYVGYDDAPDMRALRRPKHTVQPARRSKMNDTRVSQKPGD